MSVLYFFDLFGTPGDPNTKYKNLAKLHDFKRKFGDEYIEFMVRIPKDASASPKSA